MSQLMNESLFKKIQDEGIQNKGLLERQSNLSQKQVEEAIRYVLKKIDENLSTFTHKFPSSSSEHLNYRAIENIDWTGSFWTGMLWLAYEVTGDNKYRDVAEIQLESFRERLDKKIHLNHHDVGFLYTLSVVSAYKLTGNKEAKQIALDAADLLMTRYYDEAGIIQAWGDLNDPKQRGRIIIDCNMNLPLLYWAFEETGNQKYYDAAYSHIQKAANYIVRDDASTYHTFYMCPETGKPLKGDTKQGYSDESCWSRGQAWAMYGFPLSYHYTKDWRLIETAKKNTNYFLNRLPDDLVCYWDLIFTEGTEERDSSAAAIAACGLLELSKYLPLSDDNKRVYENSALGIMSSLMDRYTTKDKQSNGILLHAVYHKGGNLGVDECCIWGDYFYFEALVRLSKDWNLYW